MFSCILVNKEKNNSLVPSVYPDIIKYSLRSLIFLRECNAVYKRKSYS